MRGTGAGRHWIRPLRGTGSPSDRALQRLVGWYAVGFRLWIAVAVVVAAPLAATAAVSGAWLAAALVTLSVWSVFFAVRVGRHGVTGPLVLADAAVIVALIAVHHLVVPAALISAGTTWMLPLASTAIYISQLCIPPPAGLPVAAVVIAAYVITVAHPAGVLYLVFQALATAALMVLVRRGGRNADAAISRQLQLEQDLKVEAARRADQREQDRRLHDTILSTLTMVASGALDMSSPVLAAQASRDLQVLHSWPTLPEPGPPGAVALPDRLAAVAAEAAPLRVSTSFFSATKTMPATAVARIADCAAEALRNVARHAGTGSGRAPGPRRERPGRGGDHRPGAGVRRPVRAPVAARDLRIHPGRMAEIGGTAEISGAPGAGTTVTLRWPSAGTAETQRWPGEAPRKRGVASEGTAGTCRAVRAARKHSSGPVRAPPEPSGGPARARRGGARSGMTAQTVPGPRPSAVLAARYARALDIAVVVAAAGWQLAGAGPLLLAHLGRYPSAQFQVAAWCAIGLIIAAGSVLLLRGSSRRGTSWALAAAALVISTAAAAACPPAQMLETNWSWGAAGWVGVLVLLRRPLAELGVFLTLEALAMFAVLARDGLHQPNVAAFITVLAGSTGIQVALSVAARTLHVPAQQAEEAATREADATARQAVADRIRSARQARWLELRATAEPLLSGLAAGTADPADLAVQRACAVEAARLRRLFAEADDTPDPLVHELHACADVAQRRGVAVDIETAAQFPGTQLPGARAPRGAARGPPGHHRPGHRGPCQRNLPGARHCYRDGQWRDRQPGLRLAC